MEQLEQVLKEILNEKLIRIIISNPRKATEPKKMEVRPFQEKGGFSFSFLSIGIIRCFMVIMTGTLHI